ncbi:MAG: MauE/DoxX family redox-associated membrane protein [Pseudomonadota bacterium]
MRESVCPSGLKALDLLKRRGFDVDDRPLRSRAEVDAFKAEHGVATTPQVFIDGERIGGFDALSAWIGEPVAAKTETTYRPVIALFAVAAMMAVAVTWLVDGAVFGAQTIPWFIAISMVLLGLQKLRDVDGFAAMFRTYDLLARRSPLYGYVYPFVETGAGLLMLAGVMTWLSATAALFIAGIGAVSVFKAVYLDRRDLKCACIGGDSRAPLGFVSLLENLMMVGMAVWMLATM